MECGELPGGVGCSELPPGGVGPSTSECSLQWAEGRAPSKQPEVELVAPPHIPIPRTNSGDDLFSPRTPAQRPSGGSSHHPQHPLVSWFEEEVRHELHAISRKLDVLTAAGTRASGCNRPSSRRPTKRASTFAACQFGGILPQPTSPTSADGASALKIDGGGSDSPGGPLAMILSQAPARQQKASVSKRVSGGLPERGPPSEGTETVERDIEPKRTTTSEDLAAAAYASLTHEPSGRRRRSAEDFRMAEQACILNSHHRSSFEIVERIWAFLEDPDSSWPAKIFAMIQPWFITATVLLTLAQTPIPPLISGLPAATLEIICDTLFLTEFLLRVATCPSPKAYLCSFYALIDLLASCPLPLRLAVGPVCPEGVVETVPHALLLFAVPIIRLLKTLRRFQKLHLLLRAFNLAAEALPVLLFILFTIALFFSVLIYLAEKETMESLPKAFWFTIVTMTTVGYGDMYPTTDAGIVITGGLIIITVLYMAIPLGIVGEAFAQTWQDRDRILLMQRTRERLRQWGYTASDIPVLFRLSDGNGDGELSLTEFRQLLLRMHIGFSDERVMKLFQSLDSSHDGTIDARAFVRGLFPDAYHEIFDEEDLVADSLAERPTTARPPRSSRAERRSKH